MLTQLFPTFWAGIFTTDPEVIEAAAQYLRSYSIDCLIVCFVFNLNSYFSGCGQSVITAAHNIIATLCVRIPMSWALSRMPGTSLFAMGLAAPAASLLQVVICVAYFLWLRKKGKLYA